MVILIALIVMFSIALIAGVSLSVFSKLFSVAEDPVKAKIRECLPGINCGACGYKGCDDYADALASGDVNPSLCIPGAQSTANKVADILGVKPKPLKSVVAFVACNGNCDATHKKAEYNGVDSCKGASMLFGGDGACRFGCLGFGDCAAACPNSAICINNGTAHISTTRCIGCGLCTDICPKHIIRLIPKQTEPVVMCSNTQKGVVAKKACKNACIGCKKCEKICPNGAITVINNLAAVDYDKCSSCGACVLECPTGCLKNVFFTRSDE